MVAERTFPGVVDSATATWYGVHMMKPTTAAAHIAQGLYAEGVTEEGPLAERTAELVAAWYPEMRGVTKAARLVARNLTMAGPHRA